MCKIIVVANQKGGVAKTSTVRNLSYSLAELGKRVLTVDFDAQFNLTTCFGIENPNELRHTIATLMTNMLNDEEIPVKEEYVRRIGKVDLIPSSIQLSVYWRGQSPFMYRRDAKRQIPLSCGAVYLHARPCRGEYYVQRSEGRAVSLHGGVS